MRPLSPNSIGDWWSTQDIPLKISSYHRECQHATHGTRNKKKKHNINSKKFCSNPSHLTLSHPLRHKFCCFYFAFTFSVFRNVWWTRLLTWLIAVACVRKTNATVLFNTFLLFLARSFLQHQHQPQLQSEIENTAGSFLVYTQAQVINFTNIFSVAVIVVVVVSVCEFSQYEATCGEG